ncbi:MAG: response regulator [Alphaproteobacteria bacterium]|jgi:DNA-binding response OmpR family regulator|nr:response regulator [Alphaproteobacteria bacterium]
MSKTAKILCIEDEKDLRENISMILSSENFEVITAANGLEGYEKFISEKPNLVLCDINMPVMSGTELLEKLGNSHNEQLIETPFLFLTAYSQKDDKLNGINLGADEYVVKPIDFDILLSTIKTKIKKNSDLKSASKAKLIDLCEHVSTLIPKEIQQPLQNIITLSATLKKSINSDNIKQNQDFAAKIYLASLKLNMQISRALNKDDILNKANNINNFTTLNDIANQLKEELAELKITYNIASSLPSLSYQPLLLPIVSEYVRQHNISETKNLKLSIFLDYKKNLIISVSGQVMLPIFSEKLEEYIFEIGGDFTIKDDESETHHIISLPNHLLKF